MSDKMKTILLKNNFHGSEARVRPDKDGYISHRQVLAARKKLCGISSCTCMQSPAGERGNPTQLEEVGYHVYRVRAVR